MNTYKHIALIAAVSFFASCTKNEVVEPATNVTGTDAAVENPATETTPLFGSDAQQPDPATHTDPLLDADTYPGTSTTGGDPVDGLATGPANTPLNGKASFEHNLEVQ